MTNRPVNVDLAGGLDSVLRDVVQTYPGDSLDALRDSKRVHQAYQYRGNQFFTDVLPVLLDALLEGLKEGRLPDTSGLPFGRHRSRSIQVPRLFSALWMRVFTDSGLLREDADPTALSFLMTLLSFGKKLLVETPTKHLKEIYDEYVSIDRSLPPPSGLWEDDDVNGSLDGTSRSLYREARSRALSDLSPSDQILDGVFSNPLLSGAGREASSDGVCDRSLLADIQRVADLLSAHLGLFNPDDLVGRHGPGAVSDRPEGGYKFNFPRWPLRLQRMFPIDKHGVLNAGLVEETLSRQPDLFREEETESVLLHVPKTRRKPRLIAKESVANQWTQQAVADELRLRVSKTPLGRSIDFFDQTPSQVACLHASKDGKAATIDLSSASDRLSCWLVERIFRGNFSLLSLLVATRTRFCLFGPTAPYKQLMKLRKYASMGSALTFPVQSIVFAIIAIGVGYHLTGGGRLSRKRCNALAEKVRVFGDDIIVPVDWVDALVGVLSNVGLRVNTSKSFRTGNFRESCGMYAFKGYDVTPVRLTHAVVADSTTALSYAGKCNVAFLKGYWHLSQWIERTVLTGYRLPVVDRRGSPVGLLTNSAGFQDSDKLKWDRYLHRWYLPIRGFFGARGRKVVFDGVTLYTELVDRRKPGVEYIPHSQFPLGGPEPISGLRRLLGTVHFDRERNASAVYGRGRLYA
jgi:hypothetical protein